MKYIYLLLVPMLISCEASQLSNSGDQAPVVPTEEYTVDTVASGLDIPWSFIWLNDGTMLVAEKRGEIIPFVNGRRGDALQNVPEVYARGQGGLFDMVLHPRYDENGWIYIAYASMEGEDGGGNTKIIRARYDGAGLTDIETLYKGKPNTREGRHFGGRIAFDNDGYLYFSIGDRGNRDENPQDISRDGGKIYRLYDDGRIPEDNPFRDEQGQPTAVFSYGHRNPQGLARHPVTGEIWETEHGPRGGDEVNIIEKGKNYGWPEITYGINYSGTIITEDTAKEGMEQPVLYWDPSIAPCGTDFVTGDRYPAWKGDLLVGSLKFQYLALCDVEVNEIRGEKKLLEGIGRVRNVKMGPDDYIYVGVEGLGVVRIKPSTENQ